MGKRSNFIRHERDFYSTPYHAVEPLLGHLNKHTKFIEPCCGDGRLINHLETNGHICTYASDIEPLYDKGKKEDALTLPIFNQTIITNPPWDRKILHPMIAYFTSKSDNVWLLFDADWMHTKQSSEYMQYCKTIVSIGRVKWFDNKAGKDNAVWYNFTNKYVTTEFYGREG